MAAGRIACILAEGFEDSEFRVPYDRLRKEGFQVDIIGVEAGKELRGKNGKEKVRVVMAFDRSKKLIAAVCHGPQLLMTAGLVKGRTLTAWSTVQGDLKLAGANVKDEPVVKDGNWITSRKPEDLEQFSEAIVRSLR
jgi:protease I